MIKRVRKFGRGDFFAVETEDDDCPCCEAARLELGGKPGVLFFEQEGGPVRRVESLGLGWPAAFLCKEVHAHDAVVELAEMAERAAAQKGSSRS